jgi:hypothetical protein
VSFPAPASHFRWLAIAGGQHECQAGRYRATARRRLARGRTRRGVTRDGLDHSSDTACHHDRVDQRPGRRVAGHLGGARANAEFVILGAGERVDHAPRVPAQVPSFWRRTRDPTEQPAACQDRAERMQTRASVTSHGRDTADGEARHVRWHAGAAMQRNDTGHSRAATSASSGASVSNSAQLATPQVCPNSATPSSPDRACGSAASGGLAAQRFPTEPWGTDSI